MLEETQEYAVHHNEFVSKAIGGVVLDATLHGVETSARTLNEIISEIEHYARRKETALLTVKTSAGSLETTKELERAGFSYIETVLGFSVPLKIRPDIVRYARLPIRHATHSDLGKIVEIASDTFTENRFMKDKKFGKSAVKAYYSGWVFDSFERASDNIFVLELSGNIKGFYITRALSDTSINFNLAGVDVAEKSSLYGVALYAGVFVEVAKRGYRSGSSEILATNLHALNLFSFLGASFHSSMLRFHKWYR